MTPEQARDLVAIIRTITTAVVGHAQLDNSGMCPFCHVEGYRGSGDMTLRTGTGHRETCPITLLAQLAKELGEGGMSWCYLDDAGMALNLEQVENVVFVGHTAHITAVSDGENTIMTVSRADTLALIEALGRRTNQRCADAMRARVKPRETASATPVAR